MEYFKNLGIIFSGVSLILGVFFALVKYLLNMNYYECIDKNIGIKEVEKREVIEIILLILSVMILGAMIFSLLNYKIFKLDNNMTTYSYNFYLFYPCGYIILLLIVFKKMSHNFKNEFINFIKNNKTSETYNNKSIMILILTTFVNVLFFLRGLLLEKLDLYDMTLLIAILFLAFVLQLCIVGLLNTKSKLSLIPDSDIYLKTAKICNCKIISNKDKYIIVYYNEGFNYINSTEIIAIENKKKIVSSNLIDHKKKININSIKKFSNKFFSKYWLEFMLLILLLFFIKY